MQHTAWDFPLQYACPQRAGIMGCLTHSHIDSSCCAAVTQRHLRFVVLTACSSKNAGLRSAYMLAWIPQMLIFRVPSWCDFLFMYPRSACQRMSLNKSLAVLQSTLKIYEGETHTSPLVENPMRGGTDKLMDDILSMVKGQRVVTVQYSLCPGVLVSLAAKVCPF